MLNYRFQSLSELRARPLNQGKPFVGRILIGGKILSEGFAMKPVLSSCMHLNERGEPEMTEIGHTPNIDTEMFMRSVDAAHEAWGHGRGHWPMARMEERISAIQVFRDRMIEKRSIIVELLMWEIAKSKTDSENEFDRTIQYINDTLEAAKQLDRTSSQIHFAGGIMAQIRRSPLGVTLCMGPYNYPVNETFATLIPALLMGNTVVVKIPRLGQLVWEPLIEPFRDCFPPGVVNVVNGLGRQIINPAIRSGKIDTLAFIGSSRVANQLKIGHPEPHRFRGVLGLDAKNPAIIMEDADLDIAVSECVKGSLSFNGQRCTALKIIFVHRNIRKKFVDKMLAAVNSLQLGMPWDPGVTITPIADSKTLTNLNEYVQTAIKDGAVLVNPERGGQLFGSFFTPALLANVSWDSRISNEEQFGPIVPIVDYDRIEQVMDYVVKSPFGMQASLFGSNPDSLGSMIDALANQVCRINLNSQCQRGPDVFPFTGRKCSAEGTLSVTDALRSFSIRSMVAAKQDANGKAVFKNILNQDSSRFLSTDIIL